MENRQGKENFIDRAVEARSALYKILLAYDFISDKDNENTAENYPFIGSFDEWICEYDLWIDTLTKNFFPENKEFSPTVTVGELKEILEDIEDDVQITVSSRNKTWWLNIDSLQLPSEEAGLETIVLHTKDNFSCTQF